MRSPALLPLVAVLLVEPGIAQKVTDRSTDDRIVALQQKLKSSPKEPKVVNELAAAYLQKMRESADGSYMERAARLVETVLKADPSNYDGRRLGLQLQLQRHEFKRAAATAQALLLERPDDVIVLGLRGDALLEIGDYDGAEPMYQKMVDLRPGMASFTRVAFFRFVTGDAVGAIELMREAVRMRVAAAENAAWCLADLGQMLLKTGSLDEAAQSFQQALAAYPGYHPALAGIGKVEELRGRMKESVAAYRKAQEAVPLPEYAGALAGLYRKLGDEKRAQQQLEKLDLYDKLGQAAGERANRNLALAFADLNYRPERALSLAQAELDFRRDVYTYDALAWTLFRNGRMAEAAAAMKKALAQNTPEPGFRAHAAEIQKKSQPAQ